MVRFNSLKSKLGVAAGAAALAVLAGAFGTQRAEARSYVEGGVYFGGSRHYEPRHYEPHRHHGHRHRGPTVRYHYYDYRPPRTVYVEPPPVYYAPPPVIVQQAPAPLATEYCREFQTTQIIGGVPQPAYGTACLQPDGAWRVVR